MQSLNHWTTREVPKDLNFILTLKVEILLLLKHRRVVILQTVNLTELKKTEFSVQFVPAYTFTAVFSAIQPMAVPFTTLFFQSSIIVYFPIVRKAQCIVMPARLPIHSLSIAEQEAVAESSCTAPVVRLNTVILNDVCPIIAAVLLIPPAVTIL